jgi:xylose isomerase
VTLLATPNAEQQVITMKYATRLNSFVTEDVDVEQALRKIAGTGVIDYVDLNYPEHFTMEIPQLGALLKELDLTLNSVAMRFRGPYIHGEYTNRDPQVRRDAIELTKQGIEATAELGCDLVTVWLGFDGYDYPFQKDYRQGLDLAIEAFTELADYRPDVRISIEYKPYEERARALISHTGTVLHVIDRVAKANVGATLDFCHMLMAGDQPAFGASLLLSEDKLWGVHLNDGYGRFDDGLMVGSVHPWETAEFLYYLLRYDYQGVIYFDTFPRREDPEPEAVENAKIVDRLVEKITSFGVENITDVVTAQDGIKSHQLLTDLLK